MAVKRLKGRQAKLKDPHHTTSVVDVSCPSITYSQVRWAHQTEYDQKDVNGETDDISGVDRIWCEGARKRRRAQISLYLKNYTLLSRYHAAQIGGLMAGQCGYGPLTFPIIFRKKLNGQHWHFTKNTFNFKI